MSSVVLKHIISYILVHALSGSIQHAEAESFMDIWLSRQKSTTRDDWLSQQVASQLQAQMPSSSSFDQNEWLARQKAKRDEDWLARQAASRVDSTEDVWPAAWLSQGAHSSDSSSEDVTLSQEAWTPATSWEADEDLEQSLLADMEEALGKEHRHVIEGRIAPIEELMHPMFQALPKNEYGKLGHASVRYMLHRFFVEQHGWSIDGLFTEGAALNTSSPSHMLKDRVPMFVEGLFEKRLGGRGFCVHEMAVLVAVVEDSIHQEAQEELKKTYKALGIPLHAKFDRTQAETLIDVYMSGFVMNTNMSNVSADHLYDQTANMPVFYPAWRRAQSFFRKVGENYVGGEEIASISFPVVSAMVRELVDTFGTFHGKQCQGIKRSLNSLPSGSSGCVGLPDFYKKGLKADTDWLFIESPEYLRQLGVLDETDPKNPRLLSANYVNSPSNCLQVTGYYMVCCHNDCDPILGKLETQLGKPSATPSEITEALRATSSFGAASLRAGSLAPTLRRRLQEVAEYHGGRVPIHGRLFAQWLHHVYPQECPYPHVSGTKHPQWVEDFEDETGKTSQLTDEEMLSFVLNASKVLTINQKKPLADAGSCAPWQNEEELFSPILPSSRMSLHELENDPHLWNAASAIACLAALAAVIVSLSRTFKSFMKLKYQPKMLQI